MPIVDNEMFHAVLEGRMPIRVDLREENGEWVATHDQYGIDVEVRDDSPRMAQEGVRNAVLDRMRKGEFSVKFG